MIKLSGVDKVYRTDRLETVALSRIELEVEQGELISVMGPSGCGKSTLLNMIGLLDRPTAGTVSLAGTTINGLDDRHTARLRNRLVGFIFQSFHLISDLKVVDNVEIPLLYRRMSNRERRRQALEMLARVGLSARVHHYPSQLSGGQQQRVAVARAIVGSPKILLADEPTGNLDSHMGNEIMTLLEDLHRDQGTTIVMVTHDPGLARRTRRTIHLFDGRQVS
jgi:putative ABC transport system ATP-binding protein